MGTLEIMSHRMFQLTVIVSDDWFLNSVMVILNYDTIVFLFKN